MKKLALILFLLLAVPVRAEDASHLREAIDKYVAFMSLRCTTESKALEVRREVKTYLEDLNSRWAVETTGRQQIYVLGVFRDGLTIWSYAEAGITKDSGSKTGREGSAP